MQAIEVEATVNKDHCIHVQLPDEWANKRVRVVILQEDEAQESAPKRAPLKLGMFRGQIKMSDDFDDELPDEFWLSGNP